MLQQLNLPNVAVVYQSVTTTGLVTLAAAMGLSLVFALFVVKYGELYHRRLDRFAARDYVEPV